MITIEVESRAEGRPTFVACSINDLEAALDEENNKVNIYCRGKLIGPYKAVYGISDEELIDSIKIKEDIV